MPVPPGHLGNLTPEQELKLRDFWALTLRTFGVKDPNLTTAAPGISAPTPSTSEPNTDSESPKSSSRKIASKKRHSLFGGKRHHEDDNNSDAASAHSTPGSSTVDDINDKYGQTKEFQQTLAELSPEELRSTFWSMVKSDHPDALLLRFLRARKWDVQRALVMLISTMRWRSKEIHVDDDIMRMGEGGALEDSQSGEAFAKKEGGDFLAQMRKGKSFLHGVDKEGRPLCFVRVRLHKQGEQSDRAMERYTVFVIETARLVLRPPVETAVRSHSQHFPDH
jgi:CRAL/TRIO, N-terminal domain/CRAL/TRIO domain